jgi:hypothetical protein
MKFGNPVPRSLMIVVMGIAATVLLVLAIGIGVNQGKPTYDLIRDLFVPLIGPMVSVLIPVVVLFILPMNQTRQKLALDLCTLYYSEEMRDARNTAWHHFVTEQRQQAAVKRAERLNHFLDYLSVPEVHRGVDPMVDATYQKTTRVLDFFALVNGCVARGVADPEIVRDFLLFYYIWWRDEIMQPLRKTKRMEANKPRVYPVWWEPLTHLDALGAGRHGLKAREVTGEF